MIAIFCKKRESPLCHHIYHHCALNINWRDLKQRMNKLTRFNTHDILEFSTRKFVAFVNGMSTDQCRRHSSMCAVFTFPNNKIHHDDNDIFHICILSSAAWQQLKSLTLRRRWRQRWPQDEHSSFCNSL